MENQFDVFSQQSCDVEWMCSINIMTVSTNKSCVFMPLVKIGVSQKTAVNAVVLLFIVYFVLSRFRLILFVIIIILLDLFPRKF